MTLGENKERISRFFDEVSNKGHVGPGVDEFFASNYINHDPGNPDVRPGIEGIKRLFNKVHAAFPNQHYTIEDMIAEGDKVVVRWTGDFGKHAAEFMGIPPTGKGVRGIAGITIYRLARGKIVERWLGVDWLGMMRQLGAMPTPRQTKK